MKRTTLWSGEVDLAYDTLDFLHVLYDGSGSYAGGMDSDWLYLNDDNELDGIRRSRDMAKSMSRGNPDRERWLKVKDALKRMRAHRLALGLDGADWNLA